MPLSDETKTLIQQAYTAWLSANSFKPRRGQRNMIAVIAKALAAVAFDNEGERQSDYHEHVCLVEAGTGTGKTVAYSIAAIILAKALQKKLVISTATVTLQEQLITRDLPNLQTTSELEFSFAIAKGRQRYFCLSKASMRLKDADQASSAQGLFPDEEVRLSDRSLAQVTLLERAFSTSTWDGDRDNWEQAIPQEDWSLVAADRASCSGKKCPHYQGCALFSARDDVRSADVLVANHDLVLADLATGGGNVLPEPQDTIYVFDEAHHLPSKSQNHLSRHISIDAERRRVVTTQKTMARVKKLFPKHTDLHRTIKTVAQIDEALDASLVNVLPLLEQVFQQQSHLLNSSDELRFSHGVVPLTLRSVFQELGQCYSLKSGVLQKASDYVLGAFSDQRDNEQANKEALYGVLGELINSCDSAHLLCSDYATEDHKTAIPTARWLHQLNSDRAFDVSIYTAPLSAADTLNRLLWKHCFAAILTSATLAALGHFDHFIQQIGTGEPDRAFKILGDLNFADSVFHVPKMRSDPTQAELHTEEIIQLLPELLADDGGTLVLFSSRRQLQAVYDGLEGGLRQSILLQGERSKQYLIHQHKEAVDVGTNSVLFGLASFAEGLDLPGNYCRQVIIAKLPFAVPDSPIDEALGEWVESKGGNSFWDIAVPNASLRLLQACGRLLRGESDQGRVTLLDRRILTKSYGKQLLASLPPFEKQLNT
ncbi:MAG: ATP-dependent DNA helicase DinG [Pseudomonadales bacterium]|nr:ATP-dependent DNA helicase DinG [Pseudomonadales bacterium]